MRGGLRVSNGTLNSDENVFVLFSIDYGSCKLEEKVRENVIHMATEHYSESHYSESTANDENMRWNIYLTTMKDTTTNKKANN